MQGNKDYIYIIIFNLSLILFWDAIVVLCCKIINEKNFNLEKNMYKMRNWEEDGKWYIKKLKIKKWKDYLPQYVSKNGFSKKNLDDLCIDYIDKFIFETCRGEWAHRKCMWVLLPIFLINVFPFNLLFLFLVLLINIPYICIQRYNRFRLIKVKEKILLLSKKEKFKVLSFIRKFNMVDS